MKYKFGTRSLDKLCDVDHGLQSVMQAAIDTGIMDFSITEGHREEAIQNKYFESGKSKVKWPNGKHNKIPSEAVDVVPYVNGKASWNKLHCCVLAGIILTCAARLGVDVRWGGCWSGNFEDVGNQLLNDYVHFELVR